jgi:hypothetical protein
MTISEVQVFQKRCSQEENNVQASSSPDHRSYVFILKKDTALKTMLSTRSLPSQLVKAIP